MNDQTINAIKRGLEDIKKEIMPYRNVDSFSSFWVYKEGKVLLDGADFIQTTEFAKGQKVLNSARDNLRKDSSYDLKEFLTKYPRNYTVEEKKNLEAHTAYDKLYREDIEEKTSEAISYCVNYLVDNGDIDGNGGNIESFIELLKLRSQNSLGYVNTWLEVIESFVRLEEIRTGD